MLKSVRYENLRSECVAVQLPRHVKVSGKNGVGKTSLLIAITLGLTGRDSQGSRQVTYLAQNRDLPILITIETAKGAKIRRTVSAAGNQSIELLTSTGTRALSQKDFEGMLGATAELILSAILPGYFLSLTKDKQSEVLSEVAPKVTRRELIEQILGKALPDQFAELIESKRTNSAVENDVTTKRRAVDKSIARLEGAIQTYTSQISKLQTETSETTSAPSKARILELEEIELEWRNYREDQALLKASDMTSAIERLDEIGVLIRSIDEKRNELGDFDSSKHEREILESLKDSYRNLQPPAPPATPLIQDVIDQDNCPCCGQTVGIKHKESVRQKNREALERFQFEMDKYESEDLREYNKKRDSITADIKASEALVKQAESNEALVQKWENQRKLLETERTRLVEKLEKPKVVELPKPEKEFKEDEYREAVKVYESAMRDIGAAESRQKTLKEAWANRDESVRQLNQDREQQEALVELEEALKKMPLHQLERLKGLIKGDRFEIDITEKVIEVKDLRGTPYAVMSTGERLKVDIDIALKLTNLMPKPIRVLLVDNAELLDDRDNLTSLDVQTIQFLVTKNPN